MAVSPARGPTASADYIEPADPSTPHVPHEFNIPRRRRYCPSLLEEFLRDPDAADETLTERFWRREFERGAIRGTKFGGTWWTTWEDLLAYFRGNSNMTSKN